MAAESTYKIFIRGVAPSIDENGLELAFAKYGRIMEVLLLRDKETKASRGMGFITFECTEDCDDAVRGMNGQELKGSTLRVEIATEKPGYQNHPRGRGFNRGGRGAYPGRWVERGRIPDRGRRPALRRGPPNLNPVHEGQTVLPVGQDGTEYTQERISRPFGRRPYHVPQTRHEYAPHVASNFGEDEYSGEDVSRYHNAYSAEDPVNPVVDFAASRSGDPYPRRNESGYVLENNPGYSRQNPSYQARGHEAGYGLVDPRALDGGYSPPVESITSERGHECQEGYAVHQVVDWGREYNDCVYQDRRSYASNDGYGVADANWNDDSESGNMEKGYGIEDVPGPSRGYHMQNSNRSYRATTGSVPYSEKEYATYPKKKKVPTATLR